MPNKILSCSLLLSYLTIASFSVFAQSKIKRATKKQEHKTTIGIQTGKEITFGTTPQLHGRKNTLHYGSSKSLVLRKCLNSHFKAEAGLSYNSPENQNNLALFPNKGSQRQSNISLPLTIQYYFLPEKYRLRPYCGAGVQGTISANTGNNQPPYNGMDVRQDYSSAQTDTKYITILFTQGVTFEINTKIQVSQSFHFIPGNTTKVIGLDLGIGYKFP